ncbi:MAG: hypothetical protein JW855_02830, partial [Gammaproteobacteria bacterium]|nr:hypothetical protein [Gammaproteobacteria bacterium]
FHQKFVGNEFWRTKYARRVKTLDGFHQKFIKTQIPIAPLSSLALNSMRILQIKTKTNSIRNHEN